MLVYMERDSVKHHLAMQIWGAGMGISSFPMFVSSAIVDIDEDIEVRAVVSSTL